MNLVNPNGTDIGCKSPHCHSNAEKKTQSASLGIMHFCLECADDLGFCWRCEKQAHGEGLCEDCATDVHLEEMELKYGNGHL